jgi:hypothetical protein
MGGLLLGFVLASMVSNVANAHGRSNDGHHDQARITSVSRATIPVARAVVHRESARLGVSPEHAASADIALNEVVQCPVGASTGSAAGDVGVSRTDHASGVEAGIPPGDRLFAAATSVWGTSKTVITLRSDWLVGCCADGRGCCCQGASGCGSCGMTCCSSAVAVAGDFEVASDIGGCLHIFGAVDHGGINLGPADRPPAVGI